MKKNRMLLLALALVFCQLSLVAQYGVLGNPEWQTCVDPVTGRTLTMLTDTARNDRFLYQTDPMWTPDGKYLLFRSSDRGETSAQKDTKSDSPKRRTTQLFFIEVATGHIIQTTTGENTGAGFLANRSNRLFLNRREEGKWNLYVIDLDAFFADVHTAVVKTPDYYETFIGSFPQELGRPGSYCINSDDDWAYITVERDGTQEEIDRMNANAFLPESNQPVKIKPTLTGIRKMNLRTGEVSMVCNLEFKVGHIQASRFRPDEIVFCNETGGDAYQRMWFVKSDGSDLKPLYQETPLDWVTHETFATEDYVYFNVLGFQSRLRKQAHGIFRINLRNDDVDVVGQVETSAPAVIDNQVLDGKGFWHCNASRDGRWATGDTFAGSVWIVNTQTGERIQIASDCRMKPDHAQPFFSPDGTRLCFQSGRFSDGKRLTLMMADLRDIVSK